MKDEMSRQETRIRRYQAPIFSQRSGSSPNRGSQRNRDFGPPTDMPAVFPEANGLITFESDAPARPSRSKKCRRPQRAQNTEPCWRRDELFTPRSVVHPTSYSEATSPNPHAVSEALDAELTALQGPVYRVNGACSSNSIVWRAPLQKDILLPRRE